MQPLRGGVVSDSGLMFRRERTESCAFTTNNDCGPPAISVSRCPFVFENSGSTMAGSVPHVLGMRTFTQIGSTIIERVAIQMIAEFTILKSQNHSMHVHVSVTGSTTGIYPCFFFVLADHRVPLETNEMAIIAVINHSDKSLSELDFLHTDGASPFDHRRKKSVMRPCRSGRICLAAGRDA